MSRLLSLIILIGMTLPAYSQSRGALETEIGRLVETVPGATVAVSVVDPATRTSVGILGDRVFHAASTMKVPVMNTIERMGVRTMRVLRGVEDIKAYERGLSNTATANDLALLMSAILRGEAVSAEASDEMIAVLLEQQFNEMIPVGLPRDAKVAHKTGSITRINHDAAAVYPAGGEPYVLVILTEGVEDGDVSSRLGADIARLVHAELRP